MTTKTRAQNKRTIPSADCETSNVTGRCGEPDEKANRTEGEPAEGEPAEGELVKTNRWRRVPGEGEGEADVEATRSWEEAR